MYLTCISLNLDTAEVHAGFNEKHVKFMPGSRDAVQIQHDSCVPCQVHGAVQPRYSSTTRAIHAWCGACLVKCLDRGQQVGSALLPLWLYPATDAEVVDITAFSDHGSLSDPKGLNVRSLSHYLMRMMVRPASTNYINRNHTR